MQVVESGSGKLAGDHLGGCEYQDEKSQLSKSTLKQANR